MATSSNSSDHHPNTGHGRTPYERIGGEDKLRAIIRSFVAAMYVDPMIGFLFSKVHRGRLEELEFQHAAVFFQGPVQYRGRPLDKAHAPHRILGGQFARRRMLLREALQAHDVPMDLQQDWLSYQDSLRHLIVQ